MGKKSAVIWDIDGTLCDSFQLAFSATNEVLKRRGHGPVTAAEYHDGAKYCTPERFAHHLGLDRGSEEGRATGASYGGEFDACYCELVSAETTPLYEGIAALLRALHAPTAGRTAVLTNACGAYARAVVRAHGMDDLVPVVHGADEVPAPKPSGAGLLQCCQELGVGPADALYVGDSLTDGQAAKAAGLLAVGVTWGSGCDPALSASFAASFDLVVSTVGELQDLLASLLSS